MIAELSKELDKLALRVLQENAQSYTQGVDIAHEAGRRIGMVQGIQRARSAIIEYHSRDNAKDNDL